MHKIERRYAISVSEADHALISDLARSLNKTRSDIVREAIAGFVLIRDLNDHLAKKEIRPWVSHSASSVSPSRRSPPSGPSSTIGASDDH